MNGLNQQEMIGTVLKKAVQNEKAIAAKYEQLAKTITDPPVQKHLQSLEQTARNHMNLLSQRMQTLNIQ